MRHCDTVLSFLTGLCIALGLLVLLNQFEIHYFLYYPTTTHTVLISDSFDMYLFLILSLCVPVTAIAAFWKKERFRVVTLCVIFAAAILLTMLGELYGLLVLFLTVLGMVPLSVGLADAKHRIELEILGFTIILALVELSSAYSWIFASINPYGKITPLSEITETGLSYSLFPLSIPLVLILLSSWLWIPVISRLLENRLHETYPTAHVTVHRGLIAASLDLFALLAVIVFFYPYVAGQRWIVGVDSITRYLNPLNEVIGLGFSRAVFASIRHGVYLVLLYCVRLATGLSSFSIVKFAPLILAFCIACASFLAILRSGWSYRTAILTATCTLLWLPTTMGIFGGIQSNWSAYVLWMLFLPFLFTNTHRRLVLFAAESLISLGIFLLHPWTWGVFFASVLFTALFSVRTPWRGQTVLGAVSALALTAPVAILGYLLFPGLHSEMANTTLLYTYFVYHPDQLLWFGGALHEALNHWSTFLSPALFGVAIIGSYGLMRHPDGVAKRYLLAWIATWCLGSVLVAPLGYDSAHPLSSESALWRMFYLSPLPILLALALERCLAWSERFRNPETGGPAITQLRVVLVLATVGVPSIGLFVSEVPTVRLLAVLVTTGILLLLTFRFPMSNLARIMIATVLILLVVNAAFRSLYSLLLDPHNLLGTFGD